MPAKSEMKNLSTKKEGNVETGPKDVDNFPIFTEKLRIGKFEASGQAITKLTFQNWGCIYLVESTVGFCYDKTKRKIRLFEKYPVSLEEWRKA